MKEQNKMKKLMVVAAIVCAAAMAQASAFLWKTSTQKLYVRNASDTYGGVAYIIESASLGSVMSDFAAKTLDISDYSLSSATASSGAIAETKFDWGNENDKGNFYLVMFDSDYMYVGTAMPGTALAEGKSTPLTIKEKTASQSSSLFNATSGYQSAGWYQAVPEPTSGLLLLLGVAGLALRRRRA